MSELDKLAEHIADEVICEHCVRIATERAAQAVANIVAQKAEEQNGEGTQGKPAEPVPWHIARYGTLDSPERKAHFEKLYNRLARYERPFGDMLRKHWKQELAIILSNLKKLGKSIAGIRQKQGDFDDVVDSILYPKRQMAAKLSEEAKKILVYILAKEGQHFLDELDIDVSFDVLNPNVTKWLKGYVPKLSKALEEVNIEELKKQLIEGLEAGEGIQKLSMRLRHTFENWDKVRAVRIAQTETIRASNRANLFAMRQSKVVKKKVWMTLLDNRTCPLCESLEGKVLELEENYFNRGDEREIIVDGETHKYKFDFESCPTPPAHVSCRCSISPWIEE